jgi:hypothetical protein
LHPKTFEYLIEVSIKLKQSIANLALFKVKPEELADII